MRRQKSVVVSDPSLTPYMLFREVLDPSMYNEPAAFIQVHQQAEKEAPAPPSATWDASEESKGAVAMMDSLVADLDRMQEAELVSSHFRMPCNQ